MASIDARLQSIVEEVLSSITSSGGVLIKFYPGVPTRRLSLSELASILGTNVVAVKKLLDRVLSYVKGKYNVRIIDDYTMFVEDLATAIEVISTMRLSFFYIEAYVDKLVVVNRNKIREVLLKYIDITSSLEKLAARGDVDSSIISLWVKAASAIEIAFGKVNGFTASMLHVPFTSRIAWLHRWLKGDYR